MTRIGGTSGANDSKKLLLNMVYSIIRPEHLAHYTWSRRQPQKHLFNQFKNIHSLLFDVVSVANSKYSHEQFMQDIVYKVMKTAYKGIKKTEIEECCTTEENGTSQQLSTDAIEIIELNEEDNDDFIYLFPKQDDDTVEKPLRLLMTSNQNSHNSSELTHYYLKE